MCRSNDIRLIWPLVDAQYATMLLIAGIHHLRIVGPTGRGVHIGEDMYVTNESAQVDKRLSRELRVAIGGNELLSLLTTGTAAYWKDLPNEPAAAKGVRLLTTWLTLLRSFFMALWLIRDNPVNCELGFLEHDVPGQGTTHASNFIAALFSSARGTMEAIAFSVDEVRKAGEYFRSFFFPTMTGLQIDSDGAPAYPPSDRRPALRAQKVCIVSRVSCFSFGCEVSE